MSKKYLSLDEASAHLSIPKDELMRMREKGDIRGFADRGTWKFKIEDIEELARTRQVDSDPDVPMFQDEPEESDILLGDGSSDQDIESDILLSETSEDVGEQPTVIRKKGADLEGSDSDVRLVPDEAGSSGGSDPDTTLQSLSDSDSDVRLVSDDASDSDVRLVGQGSDAEVELVRPDEGGSDSDVKLVGDAPEEGSDSDVQLVDTSQSTSDDSKLDLDFSPDDSMSASVLSDESGIGLGDESAIALSSESGISLEGPSDSGTALEGKQTEDDESITLGADSGIALDNDSGITLDSSEDSGISLDIAGDSGISLESAADSGISLESVGDSGISLEDSGGVGGGTIPMMDAVSDEDSLPETQFEIPSLAEDDDSAYELTADDADTGQMELVDSGEQSLDDAVFDLDEDDSAEVAEFDDDELEVSDEILGEDDELDELDVFDADDEVFEESGVSQEFAAPLAARGPVAGGEAEWGPVPFVGLLVSTVCLVGVGV
ncbi:MAG: helix-turn-helix domain-containing protein, partial [Maioricimonas sp. JB049]